MRFLLAGLAACLALGALPLASAQDTSTLTFTVGSEPVVEQQVPDMAVPHHAPAVLDGADALGARVPAGPDPTWGDQGLTLQERESRAALFVPWLVNAGATRVDSRNVYPLNIGDVQYDLRDEADTVSYLGTLLAPSLPQPALATRVPDLQLGLSLRDGVRGCVGACPAEVLDALAANLPAASSFARGFGAPSTALVPEARTAWLAEAQPGVPSERSAPAAPLTGDAGLAAETAGPASMLPSLDAGTAALAIAAGLLLLAAPAALYSKIRRDSTLENETRRVIYEAVVATPGLSIQDVARRASVSHSTAAYHLERLSSAGLVVATGDGNKVRYYRNGGRFTEQERRLLPILENAETVRVLETVMASPWTYRAEIAQKLGVTATTVNWHLKRLFGCAVLTERREGRNAYLFVERTSLHVALTGLHEKLAPSPPRDVAARLLAQLGPITLPAVPPPAAPTLASLPPVPPPNAPSTNVTVAGTVYPRLARPNGPQMGFAPSNE